MLDSFRSASSFAGELAGTSTEPSKLVTAGNGIRDLSNILAQGGLGRSGMYKTLEQGYGDFRSLNKMMKEGAEQIAQLASEIGGAEEITPEMLSKAKTMSRSIKALERKTEQVMSSMDTVLSRMGSWGQNMGKDRVISPRAAGGIVDGASRARSRLRDVVPAVARVSQRWDAGLQSGTESPNGQVTKNNRT
ncbi:hypothetical protein HOI83_03815 [Candidatus Uhrbacteria bacterium]|nr:hypothetical protein [Candidatus Uhrbacteria bacterium]